MGTPSGQAGDRHPENGRRSLSAASLPAPKTAIKHLGKGPLARLPAVFSHGRAQFIPIELNILSKVVKVPATGFSAGCGGVSSGRRTLIPKAISDTLTTFMVVKLVV